MCQMDKEIPQLNWTGLCKASWCRHVGIKKKKATDLSVFTEKSMEVEPAYIEQSVE